MRIVAVKPFNHPMFFCNGIFDVSKEPRSRIFVTARDVLRKHGYDLVTSDMPQARRAQAVIALDVPYPWDIRSWWYLFLHRRHAILFHWEPPIINPFNYMFPIRFLFPVIYTWNDLRVDGKKFKKFYYPKTDTGFVQKEIPFLKKKLLTMVASNLSAFLPFQLLACSSELYSVRQRLVHFFDRYAPNEFDLYGRGWNRPRRFSIQDHLLRFRHYATYRGVCKDQYKTLSQYRFALCLENVDSPGYVCEKMFDCMKAGCVPVYLGASNVSDVIPKECFVDLRDFPRYHDLLTLLRSMDVQTYKRYQRHIKEFLKRHDTRERWFEEGFGHFVFNALQEVLN